MSYSCAEPFLTKGRSDLNSPPYKGGEPLSLRSIGCRNLGSWLLILVTVIGLMAGRQTTLVAGQEVVNRDQDIVLQVDSRWPGNAYGGYFPLRIKLSNMGQPRDLTLVYQGRGSRRDERLPEVRRSVRVEQQATINFTLSIPVVSANTDGTLLVFDSSGDEIKGLTSRHALPEYGGSQPRTSLLVISSVSLDDKALQPFEDAAATECAYRFGAAGGAGSLGAYGRHYSSHMSEHDHVVLQPSHNLPVNWIDYSGLDLVAVAWPDWNSKLSAAEREAILKWTATGGVLLLFGTELPAAKSEELNRSLQLTGSEAAAWVDCSPETHCSTGIVTAAELRTGVYTGGMRRAGMPPGPKVITEQNDDAQAAAANEANQWPINKETYSQRDWSLGKIYVFPGNPFPGTPSNWAWWLAALPKNLSHWPAKEGMTARNGNAEFLNFLIPGVGSVPVFAFLTLITLFTVIIGPLNYYWLHKQRRLAAMVFTVPLIAGVTCVLLFTYSLIADGFSIRTRVNSFTWLDQQRKSAVSVSRLCLYAPFAPSAGLNFSPECAVFPIWPSGSGFEEGVLDWSGNDQRLTAGWFRSQTWTQFQTVEHRDERGRLDFTPPSDPNSPTLAAANGLSWDLEYLAINTKGGTWYAGENIPAGATAQLKLLPADEIRTHFHDVLERNAWEFPPGITAADPTVMNWRSMVRYGGEPQLQTNFSQGLLVRNLPHISEVDAVPRWEFLDWRDGKNGTSQQPHMASQRPHFWALCRQNPGVQTGVKSSVDRNSLHVVFGTF